MILRRLPLLLVLLPAIGLAKPKPGDSTQKRGEPAKSAGSERDDAVHEDRSTDSLGRGGPSRARSDEKPARIEAPRTREEIRATVAAKYAEVVKRYQGKQTPPRKEYLPLIEALRKFAPGALGKKANQAQAKKIFAEAKEVGMKIISESDSPEALELRMLYKDVEENDMPEWQKALAGQGAPKEQQARFANFAREELKLFVRDLMTDANAKELLYVRDQAVYGQRNGPTFDQLMAQNRGGGMTVEEAYDAIIESSQRSNQEVNAAVKAKL